MSKDPMPTFPSPTAPAASRTEVHLRYLDYFRAVLLAKLDGLPPHELRSSRLPSRWTPLELLKHLTHVEARWLEWGFEGRDIGDPWSDQCDGRWHVPAEEHLIDLVEALGAQALRSRAVVEAPLVPRRAPSRDEPVLLVEADGGRRTARHHSLQQRH